MEQKVLGPSTSKEQFFSELGEPRYRARQLFSAMHRGVPLEAITNISKATKEKIAAKRAAKKAAKECTCECCACDDNPAEEVAE